ncbi:MAG: hypothetical protein OXD42_08080 [Rhodospirillaceae bacterium]|nr:hypothetical protein [Rhodospirillaceae bacterium]
MSVLAEVVRKGSMQSEPAATQALAYILNSSPDIARVIVRLLRPARGDFEPGRIEAELGHEDSQPDLTVYDSHGRVRAFVENKFWAGLTDAQPVSYLAKLPGDPPGCLLFIVPRRRVDTVWNELGLRCSEADLEWEADPGETSVRCSRVDGKIMLITSWAHVLEGLLDAARAGEHDAIRHDILQLQGLTSRMDAEAFLPLRGDEITDQETARRLINYNELIEDITSKLKDSGVANTQRSVASNGRHTTKRLVTSHGQHTSGRYLILHEKFELWLGIDLLVWRDFGITPLWAQFSNNDSSGVAGHHQTILGLFDDAQVSENYLYIPIRLRTGVERDRVIGDAVAQMTRLADTLRDQIPDS